jgi:alpha-tubulin suppressor-like RCC1 family protein
MTDGSVRAFGYNPQGQTYVPSARIRNQAVKVAAGANHSLVLLRDGTVVGFGSNEYDQIDPMPAEALPGGLGVQDIAAGDRCSLFLLKNSSVIGVGDKTYHPLFSLPAATQQGIRSISCRWELCGAVKTSGELVLWGHNNSQIDAPTTISPVPPEVQAAGVASVSMGVSHVAAMLRNGQGAVWGLNDYGQSSFPADMTPGNVKAITAGSLHTLVLLNDGHVRAFGRNNEYQARIPTSVNSATVFGVEAGGWSSCALLLPQPEPPPPRMWHLLSNCFYDALMAPECCVLCVTNALDVPGHILRGRPIPPTIPNTQRQRRHCPLHRLHRHNRVRACCFRGNTGRLSPPELEPVKSSLRTPC